MSTSQRTFDQVKSILGKLDQRIDALRERRNTDPVLATPTVPVLPVMPVPAKLPEPAAPPPPRTAYGRATPLRGN